MTKCTCAGEQPERIKKTVIQGKTHYIIRINIVPTKFGWAYEEFLVLKSNFNYDFLVNTLITEKYPTDKMQAVINNYLLDSSNPDNLKEFEDMQNYRKIAKTLAQKILNSKSSMKN